MTTENPNAGAADPGAGNGALAAVPERSPDNTETRITQEMHAQSWRGCLRWDSPTLKSDPVVSVGDDIDQRADAAWDSLNAESDWSKWRAIGDSMLHARNTIMRDTHSNRPAGRGYNAAFSQWLAKRKFGDMDRSDRARLLKCMEHENEIEAWRATLTGTELKRLNHPSSVWRKWQASTKMRDPTKEKKPSAIVQLKEAHITAVEENHKLKQRLARGDGNLFTSETSAREAAKLFVSTFSVRKWKEIVQEANKLIEAKKCAP